MRKIAIVGGGQCGLHLGFGLIDQGYDVTLFSDRSPDQLLGSRIPSTAFLFNEALQMERRLGLNFWEDEAPIGEGILIDARNIDGTSMLSLQGRLHGHAGRGLDQRTKFARWMQEFANRGGNLIIQKVTLNQLDDIAEGHELTLVASGKESIKALFKRDNARNYHQGPSRNLAGVLLRGSRLTGDRPWPRVAFRPLRFNLVAGAGEFFSLPFFTHTAGECRSLLFEAIPGRALDRFQHAADGAEVMAIARQAFRDFSPEEAIYLDEAELTDANAWLKGSFSPTVCEPVGRLPSGAAVMGVGDAVCLNDPIAGQGANNASKMADHLIRRIVDTHDGEFDERWMQRAFDDFWHDTAEASTAFTNHLLDSTRPALQHILREAAQRQTVADRLVSCFADPRRFRPWINEVEQTGSFIDGEHPPHSA